MLNKVYNMVIVQQKSILSFNRKYPYFGSLDPKYADFIKRVRMSVAKPFRLNHWIYFYIIRNKHVFWVNKLLHSPEVTLKHFESQPLLILTKIPKDVFKFVQKHSFKDFDKLCVNRRHYSPLRFDKGPTNRYL